MTKKMLTVPQEEFAEISAQINELKGFPCWHRADIGPDVYTERWTDGIPLVDGNIGVEVDDHIESELGKKIKTKHKVREVGMSEFKRKDSDDQPPGMGRRPE